VGEVVLALLRCHREKGGGIMLATTFRWFSISLRDIQASSEHSAFQGGSFTRSGHSDRPCGFSFKPQELVILAEWLPETLDSDKHSREAQHLLRAHQPECKDA
jgi:hypothetical protein